jgi:hypothetical protein
MDQPYNQQGSVNHHDIFDRVRVLCIHLLCLCVTLILERRDVAFDLNSKSRP